MDVKDIAASLPVPGVDEKPPDHGILTAAEVKEIRAKERAERGGRRDWSNPAEAMMVRILKGAFGAANVKREADRMQGWQDAEGKWHYHYANLAKPDITGALIWDNKLTEVVMEVKSVSPTSTGLDVTETNIKLPQKIAMDKAHAQGKLCLWGLVFWEEPGKARCFVVEHRGFMRIIDVLLPNRSSGNYKGRSLRRAKDLDLLEKFEVLKTNRWLLPETGWAVYHL